MSKMLSFMVAALFAASSATALAQDKKTDTPKKEPTAAQKRQQERMKECNAQAAEKGLKGDERKKFMSACLKPAAKKGAAKKGEPKKS